MSGLRLGTGSLLVLVQIVVSPAVSAESAGGLVGQWEWSHSMGSSELTFYANGVFVHGSGGRVTSRGPTGDELSMSTWQEKEAGTYRVDGKRLVLTWHEDGSTESLPLKLGGGTLRLGKKGPYLRRGAAAGKPTLPKGLPNAKFIFRRGGQQFEPPILGCVEKKCYVSASSGLVLHLRTYATHGISLELGVRSMQLLVAAGQKPLPLAKLPDASLSVMLRAGHYTNVKSGVIALAGGKTPRGYVLTLGLKDVVLGAFGKKEQEITFNGGVVNLSVEGG